MKSFWNLFLLFLECVYVFNTLHAGEGGFILWLNISESSQYLLSSNYCVLARNFLCLQCGEQKKTESSAASHHPSSDAKECQEILGGVLVGWVWSGYSPASLQISLPDLDSDGQTSNSGSNKILKSFNVFLRNLQLLSRLCIYVFVYSCFLLYVCV